MEAHLIQNTPEWLAWRKGKIGASSLSVIMGQNPWKSPYALWSEMLGLRDPEPANERMQRGTDLEPLARDFYFNLTGMEMFPKVVVHPRSPKFFASLDGMNSIGTQILEIKCGGKKLHDDAKSGIIPEYYNSQMQWQMYITELYDCHYLSFDGTEGVLIVVKRDQDLINQMIIKAQEFLGFLETITPPPFTDLDYEDKSTDEGWNNLMEMYSRFDHQEKVAKENKERVREALIKYSDGRNVKGSQSKFTSYTQKGKVKYDSIPELANVDLDKYRKPDTQCYRITFNKD